MLERVFVCTFFVFLYLLVFKHLVSPAMPFLSLFIFVAVVVVVVVVGGGGVVVVVVGSGGYLLCGFTLLFPRGLEEFLFGEREIFLFIVLSTLSLHQGDNDGCSPH